MTSSARDRATDAVAGEVPAPAGDAPPTLPDVRLAPDGSLWRGLGSRWAKLVTSPAYQLAPPADAVPLVPAGGSAPADEPKRGPVTAPDCLECGGPLFQTFPSRQWHHWYPSHRDHAPVLPSVLGPGGSAPHQGATTDEPAHREAALRKLADEWAQHARDQAELANRVDDAIASNVSAALWSCAEALRAALGAATTTAPEATDA